MKDLFIVMLVVFATIFISYPVKDRFRPPSQEITPAQLYSEIDYLEKQMDDCKRICYPNSSSQYGPDIRETAKKRLAEFKKMRRQYVMRYNRLLAVEDIRKSVLGQGLPKNIPLRYE